MHRRGGRTNKCGQGRGRTGDLSLFRRTLLPAELPGQLMLVGGWKEGSSPYRHRASATPTGLEPATSAVTGRRANQLRHGALDGPITPFGRPRNYSAGPVSVENLVYPTASNRGCPRNRGSLSAGASPSLLVRQVE